MKYPYESRRLTCDTLVIGGGGAGICAAIAAKAMGADVLVAAKSKVGYANNTFISAGAFSSSGWGDPLDGPEAHLKDIVVGGRLVNDVKLAKVLAREAHDQVPFLERCGVDFSKREGSVSVGPAPGHRFPRNVRGINSRGSDFMLPIVQHARQTGVRFLDNTTIAKLYVHGNRIAGVLGLHLDGALLRIFPKSVILATGGFARIYHCNNNAPGITGDGHALAYEAGLTLRDMEFVQFYPVWGTLYEVTVVRSGARLKNSKNEDILEKYGMLDPNAITRDLLSRAVYTEISAGLGVDGGVILDTSLVSEKILDRIRRFLPKNPDGSKTPRIVAPTAHFCMGGVMIDDRTKTTVNGLFAAGEICGGVHGANRLGGNALAEVFSMGRIAGKEASDFSRHADPAPEEHVDFAPVEADLSQALNRSAGQNTIDLKSLASSLKQTMWNHAGIIRNRAGLQQAISRLDELTSLSQQAEANTHRELAALLSIRHMLTVSQAVCRAALMRTESRGSHYREDFPEENNRDWLCNILIRKQDDRMALSVAPVDRAALSEIGITKGV